MVNTQKKFQIDSLNSLLKEKSNFLLVKIDKATHQSLESLRKELRKNDSSLKVIKNTLFQKSVNLTSDKPLLKELRKKFFPIKEPSALVTFEKDWNGGLKSIYDFIKKEKTLSFKLGLLDNSLYGVEEMEKIAQVPSREELVGKIIGSFKSPMSKFVYAMKFNSNKLVYILQAKSKGGGN